MKQTLGKTGYLLKVIVLTKKPLEDGQTVNCNLPANPWYWQWPKQQVWHVH